MERERAKVPTRRRRTPSDSLLGAEIFAASVHGISTPMTSAAGFARLVVNATGSVNPIIIASLIASGLATTGIIVNPIEDVVCASSSFQQISCVCDVIPSANSTAAELVHSHRTHSNRNALAALLVTSGLQLEWIGFQVTATALVAHETTAEGLQKYSLELTAHGVRAAMFDSPQLRQISIALDAALSALLGHALALRDTNITVRDAPRSPSTPVAAIIRVVICLTPEDGQVIRSEGVQRDLLDGLSAALNMTLALDQRPEVVVEARRDESAVGSHLQPSSSSIVIGASEHGSVLPLVAVVLFVCLVLVACVVLCRRRREALLARAKGLVLGRPQVVAAVSSIPMEGVVSAGSVG